MQNKPDESNKEIKYWHCQPYIRSLPNSNASLNIGESVKLSESVDQTNIKCESEIIDPEVARKLSKIIERKKRKQERIDRKLKYNDLGNKQKTTKYVNCDNCKNPRGETCSFNLCRKCCKDKVWNEQKECKGL
jgi:tRNA-dihydrouridine synthase 1